MRIVFKYFVIAVTLCAAACKGGDANRDGGLFDASVDDGAVLGSVQVTVLYQGKPVAAAHVYFANPDGSRAGLSDTDPNGVASGMLYSGGSVTAAFTTGSGQSLAYRLFTDLDVSPGDNIVLEMGGPPTVPYGVATMTTPDRVGTSVYQVANGCNTQFFGEPPPASTLIVNSGCADPTGRFDAFVRANDSTGQMAAYQTLTNLSMNADGGMVTANYTFNGVWQTPTHSMLSTNYPPNGWKSVQRVAKYYRNNHEFYNDSYENYSPTTGYNSSSMHTTSTFFDSQVLEIVLNWGYDAGFIASNSVHRERDAINATVSVDFGNFLPYIHDPVIGFTNNQLRVSYTSDGDSTHAHGGIMHAYWSETLDAGGSAFHEWYCAFNPAITPILVPSLPPELYLWAVQADRISYPGGVYGYPDLTLIQGTHIGSHAAFRTRPFNFAYVLPSGPFSLYTAIMYYINT